MEVEKKTQSKARCKVTAASRKSKVFKFVVFVVVDISTLKIKLIFEMFLIKQVAKMFSRLLNIIILSGFLLYAD